MNADKEWTAFENAFNRIMSVIIPANPPKELTDTMDWLKNCFYYNVPHGKRNRGLAVVSTYRILAQQQNKETNEEQLELACILGWTVEILQAYFLVVDDMMDRSITRRGQPCWYKLDNVGLMSCNDAIMIDQENYHILYKFFSDKKYYKKVVELIHEITRYTAYGQCMDTASNPPDKRPQFQLFSQLRYESIVKYKTSLYSFVLPVRLAMYMSSVDSEEEHKNAEEILLKIGLLFQIQDDYLDCFGDPAIIGKIGTDIEEGKCCWVITTAFRLSNQKQLEVLKENYGIKDGDCVRRVKAIYNDLNLKQVFEKEEELHYKDICQSIDNLKNKSQLSPKIFTEFLDKIYKRQK